MTAPYWLNYREPDDFPDVEQALTEPDGLLAVGGDLSVERLVAAYRRGIFPWYSDEQPILWWSPNPRAVLFLEQLKISRSLRKSIRNKGFEVRFDTAFEAVIAACAAPRSENTGTWITDEMREAYIRLYRQGIAHSIECWQGDKLVGGLYGLAIGKIFFGESMFSHVTDASKVAFVFLVRYLQSRSFKLLDCQVTSPHLTTLGATTIPRSQFVHYLNEFAQDCHYSHWQLTSDESKTILKFILTG